MTQTALSLESVSALSRIVFDPDEFTFCMELIAGDCVWRLRTEGLVHFQLSRDFADRLERGATEIVEAVSERRRLTSAELEAYGCEVASAAEAPMLTVLTFDGDFYCKVICESFELSNAGWTATATDAVNSQ